MECGCRLEIESSGTHLSCWAQMHCSPPRCVTHSYCTTHTSALARIHIRTRAQTNAVTLALPPPPLPSLPPSLCNVGQWWAQTPVRADNCLPDDATERRQGAMVKGTTPVPCVQQHQPLMYAERQHTTKGLFLTDTSRFLSARTCRANTHSRSASEANVCTCGRPRLYLLLLMRWLTAWIAGEHLADRREEIAGLPSLLAPHISCLEPNYSPQSSGISQEEESAFVGLTLTDFCIGRE